jgi:hypothetical protein
VELHPVTDDILIRASSTPTILDCPRRWAARALGELVASAGYELRQLPTHIGAPIGTGVHAAAAHLLQTKRDRGEPSTFKEAEAVGMASLDQAIAEAGELMWDGTAGDRNDAQRQVTRMAIAYADQIVPKVEPVLVEENKYATWEPGFIVKGQLDDVVLYSARKVLRDTKTGSTPSGAIAQVGTYSLLLETHRMPVEQLLIDFIKRAPLKKPQPPAKTFSIDLPSAEAAAEEAISTAVASVKAFRLTANPKSFRANPSSKLCAAKWCPAWGTEFCKAHFPEGDED